MRLSIYLVFSFCCFASFSQVPDTGFEYEPSLKYPWGRPNPTSPNITEYEEMIGTCDCRSITRNPDQTWADTTSMIWKFKYIMNGTAIQDEVWRPDGRYAGSIRQFNSDSSRWVVTYFSNPGTSWSPGVWHGSRLENEIILYKNQPSPNGLEGYYKITFFNLREEGFDWKGEWVNKEESIVYPTWMIFCQQRKS